MYFLDNVESVDLEAIERSCAAIGKRVRSGDPGATGDRPAAAPALERPPD
jgi:hypothetical protein